MKPMTEIRIQTQPRVWAETVDVPARPTPFFDSRRHPAFIQGDSIEGDNVIALERCRLWNCILRSAFRRQHRQCDQKLTAQN